LARGIKRNVIVDIPAEAYVVSTTARVWIPIGKSEDKTGRNRPVVLTIGKAFSETQMYPNDNFRRVYPAVYAKAAHTDMPIFEKRIGLYAVMLSIGEKYQIYQNLIDSYGIQYANTIVDFSMYMILSRKNVAELYPTSMQQNVLFSGKVQQDEWLSDFFENKITENQTAAFNKAWIKQCQDMGIVDVWVCADGSNDDCDAQDVEDAEAGKNKSGTNKNVFGYFFVVNAADGMPITYRQYRGGRPDCLELFEIIDIVKGYGFRVKGFILDRGFATIDVIRAIREAGYAYIIMLKNNSVAQRELIVKHAKEINMAFRHCVNDEGTVFGIVEKVKLFSSYPDEAYVGLFYDSKNGRERASHLIRKIRKCLRAADVSIRSGVKPDIPSDLKKYIDLTLNEAEGKWEVGVRFEVIDQAVDEKGYSSIATSEDMSAEELHRNYHLRDASEEEYSIFKSQLGESVTRVHHSNGCKSKMAVGFTASIYRFFMMQVARQFHMNTNLVVHEMNSIRILQISGDNYAYSRTSERKQIELLSAFGVSESDLEEMARLETVQERAPERNPVQRMPVGTNFPYQKGKRGRKKGSRNKKTIEREMAEVHAQHSNNETNSDSESAGNKAPGAENVKRKRGRPPGSRNKKTLEREAQSEEKPVKRGKGRPPGAKNKKTLAREAEEEKLRAEGKLPPKRGKGRPPGSKNKKTLAREAEIERLRAEGKLPPKRGPGRPRLTSNK